MAKPPQAGSPPISLAAGRYEGVEASRPKHSDTWMMKHIAGALGLHRPTTITYLDRSLVWGSCEEITLKFIRGQDELAFLKDSSTSIEAVAPWGALVYAGVGAIAYLNPTRIEMETEAGEGLFRRLDAYRLSAFIFQCVLCLLMVINVSIWTTRRPLLTEVSCVFLLGLYLVLVPFSEPLFLVATFSDDEVVVGTFSECKVTLFWLAAISLPHAFLRVRFFVLTLLDAAVIVMYAISSYMQGIEGRILQVCVFCALVCSSAFGKRRWEIDERLARIKFANEGSCNAKPTQQFSHHSLGRDIHQDPKSQHVVDSPGEDISQKGNIKGSMDDMLLDERNVTANMRLLGTGAFCCVFQGTYFGAPVALKSPFRRDVKHTRKTVDGSLDQIRCLHKVRHPNIVAFHGICLELNRYDVIFVMELSSGSTLKATVEGNAFGTYSTSHSRHILDGTLSAIHYLHTREPPIVLGSMTADNIVVEVQAAPASKETSRSVTLRPKLLDFGLARAWTGKEDCQPLHIRWSAPEIILSSAFLTSPPSDIFSFGRIMYYCLTKKKPLAHMDVQEIGSYAIRHGSLPDMQWSGESDLEVALQPVAETCVRVIARERPSSSALRQSFDSGQGTPDSSSKLCPPPGLFRSNELWPQLGDFRDATIKVKSHMDRSDDVNYGLAVVMESEEKQDQSRGEILNSDRSSTSTSGITEWSEQAVAQFQSLLDTIALGRRDDDLKQDRAVGVSL